MPNLKTTLLLLCFAVSLTSTAGNIKLSGNILMPDSSEAAFANVHLFKVLSDSLKHESSTVANLKGQFSFKVERKITYELQIDAIGSPLFKIKDLTLLGDTVLSNIALNQGTELDKIVIRASTPPAKVELDKKVFKISENPSSTGGSAVDVLNNLPSVDVDQDGTVSLRGNGNIRILIDGKPTGITANDLSAFLAQLPASSIESIEVVTVPSAKYDAESAGGVINITLKENKLKGWQGNAEISYGNWDKINASASLGYRSKKHEISTNYGYSTGTFTRNRLSQSGNESIDSLISFDNTGSGWRKQPTHLLKSNYRLKVDSTLGVGASLTLNHSVRQDSANNLYEWTYTNDPKVDRLRNSYSERTQQRLIGNLFADKKWNSNALSFNSIISLSKTDNNGSFEEEILRQSEVGNTAYKEFIQKLDWRTSGKYGTLSLGGQFTKRQLDNNYEFYEDQNLVDSIANQLNYWDQISAAYFEWKKEIKNVTFTLGHRMEYTHLDSKNTNNNLEVVKHYWMHFPSLNLSHQINKQNKLGFNYSRRITRPNAIQLNPSPSLADPYSLHTGNPDLIPATNDINELSWIHQQKKFTVQTTLFYQLRLNRVRRIRFVDENGVSNVKWMNYDREDYYGIELFSRVELSNNLDLNFTANVYERITDGSNIGEGYTARYFGWDGKANLNVKLPNRWRVFLNAIYKSPKAIVIGTIDQRYYMDAGIRKKWLKGRLTTSLRLSDVFNTRQFEIATFVDDWDQQGEYKRESRILFFAVKYKLINDKKEHKGKANSIHN